MGTKKRGRHKRQGLSRRAKEGGRSFLPGPYLSISVSLVAGQLEQLDHLAVEIRALSGKWITRSGILTAIIEASLQTAARPDAGGEAEGSGPQ
ncbi:MAG TPA: hypothetical protein VNN25_02060 [Thermoanaerobaculia bacterium]|nr:hypothetical protein [Thermoanaerobaculia bacterium]